MEGGSDSARQGMRRWKMTLLRMLKGALDAIQETECVTIGNMHPAGLHCFSCTFRDLKERVGRAVKFWDEEDRWKNASS